MLLQGHMGEMGFAWRLSSVPFLRRFGRLEEQKDGKRDEEFTRSEKKQIGMCDNFSYSIIYINQ